MRPTFDIEALRAMVIGAELGSFARAAAELGRSQSAVSMQLKRLEAQAGRPLFRRSGRGLAPTEAGDTLLAHARRIVAMHDAAAAALGAAAAVPDPIRIGLPQDFFEDVVPDALTRFAARRPGAPVEVRAGRNYALEEEIVAGRIDVALAFAAPGRGRGGEHVATMPVWWFAGEGEAGAAWRERRPVPLVLFDHPCLFRTATLAALDAAAVAWRPALTTPSLAGVWAALRCGLGITARTAHRVPEGIRRLDPGPSLPPLPPLELRLLARRDLSAGAEELRRLLEAVVREHIGGGQGGRGC